MPKERLDKILVYAANVSRKGVRQMLKSARVTVNGCVVKDAAYKVDANTDTVALDGAPLSLERHVYYMLHKPLGVISSTDGKGKEPTVLDLVPPELQKKGLFPAGRLDKDTTGFVLLTNDGAFAHDILSPRHHIEKTYVATLSEDVTEQALASLRAGIELKDGTKLLPAEVACIDGDLCRVRVQICEGKYHQIKRMFAAAGNRVIALHRSHMGALELDPALKPGACRPLTPDELQQILERDSAE